MRLLGIDYGSKRIGIALGDTETRLALPLITVANRGRDFVFAEIKKIIATENVEKIVVGLPLGLNGQRTAQTEETERFINEFKAVIGLLIVLEDERLTSAEVIRAVTEMKRASSRRGRVKGAKVDRDSAAAAIILQKYLDKAF